MLVLLADAHAAAGLPAAALPYALTARLHAKQSSADLLVRPRLCMEQATLQSYRRLRAHRAPACQAVQRRPAGAPPACTDQAPL